MVDEVEDVELEVEEEDVDVRDVDESELVDGSFVDWEREDVEAVAFVLCCLEVTVDVVCAVADVSRVADVSGGLLAVNLGLSSVVVAATGSSRTVLFALSGSCFRLSSNPRAL